MERDDSCLEKGKVEVRKRKNYLKKQLSSGHWYV